MWEGLCNINKTLSKLRIRIHGIFKHKWVFPETKRLKISKVDGSTHRNKLGEKKLNWIFTWCYISRMWDNLENILRLESREMSESH